MQSYAAIYVLKDLFRAQLTDVVVYTILIIVGDVSLKPTKFHTQSQCRRQGGGNRGSLPRAPIVRGPPNSAKLQIRSIRLSHSSLASLTVIGLL